ncbi:hypothetical protein [Desulfofalx alkaliphila]|uniref:hypothetical protein n=1 Tax=Desulfofalx alkaliphila TaxID=105483 RepID=UPI0004E21920|nr:hypothetical protein [Desulfofalx alkaliphila]
MDYHYRGRNKGLTDGVNLLISILVRYPQVSTINFEPQKGTLRFNFIFNYSSKEPKNIIKLLQSSIDTYHMLEGKKARVVLIDYNIKDDYTVINIERDTDSLNLEEISLIVQCLQQSVKTNIIIENIGDEEDLYMHEELIEAMLENVRYCNEEKPLFAFREEGRVLVFNK